MLDRLVAQDNVFRLLILQIIDVISLDIHAKLHNFSIHNLYPKGELKFERLY